MGASVKPGQLLMIIDSACLAADGGFRFVAKYLAVSLYSVLPGPFV